MIDIAKLYHTKTEYKYNDYENPNIQLIDFQQNHDFFQSVDTSIHSIPTAQDNCRMHINKEFVLNNPDINWIERNLNTNNFTIEDIEEIMAKLNKCWDIKKFNNLRITPKLYEKYADQLNFKYIGFANNITIELIRATINADWDWGDLSYHFQITDIIENLDLPWVYSCIINKNKSINIHQLSILIHQLNRVISLKKESILNWKKITKNKGVTIEDIKNTSDNPMYCWEYNELFKNPHFTIKYLDYYMSINNLYEKIEYKYSNNGKYIDNKQDKIYLLWKYLSKSRLTTLADIDNHPEYPWDFIWVSCNPNLTIDFIHKYRYKIWNNEFLQQNSAISVVQFIEYKKMYPYELNYKSLSMNNSINLEYVINNPNQPWDYRSILFFNHTTYDYKFYNSQISKLILKANLILKLNYIIESYVEFYV
jgi:hypothetical protein